LPRPVDRKPPSRSHAAEEVFADFLEQLEEHGGGDFDALCAAHPELATTLRRLHVRWRAVSEAFGRLSSGGGPYADAPNVAAPAVDELLSRLAHGGARLDRYAIGPELARGAMGRVVRAFDAELRRDVALKIQRGDDGDARQRRRFLEEAQITAQLDHPGIVPIHELGLDDDGRPFFSMQLVRGRHLGELLAAAAAGDPEWTRTRVLNVLLRVCEAMAFAHDKGVVHRDLKPANVMVGRFGETYVMDWGLARVVGAVAGADEDLYSLRSDLAAHDEASPLLTRVGDVVGTPAYMAPEQADGTAAAASPAVDVYAVGAILYHLLQGHPPYGERTGDGVERVLQRLRQGPPARLPDEVPGELRAICDRAMARSPADRYASMAELADDLRAFLEVRTVRAYATGRFAELQKWVLRNRALATAVVLLFVAVAAGGGLATHLWLRADEAHARAEAGAVDLQAALDRSAFRSARQSLQLDDSTEAGELLWRAHFAGRMPRATHWALTELMERDPYLVTVPVHEDSRPVAWARAAGVVLLGTATGSVEVRDGETLALREVVGSSGAAVTALEALGDGDRFAAGTAFGELWVHDLVQRTELHRSRPHEGALRVIAASMAKGFATGGADGKVLWWPEVGATPRRLLQRSDAVSSLVVTPENDGVMAGDVGGVLEGVALDRGWRVQLNLGGQLTALACGSKSNELWVGSTSHALRFLDFVDRKRDLALPTHNGTCRELVRDDDGSVFAGGWWRTSHVAPDGKTLAPAALRGISRMAFDRAGRRLVTSGASCGLGLVDVSDRGQRTIPGWGPALSRDGTRLVCLVGNGLEIHDVDAAQVLLRAPGATVGALAIAPTGAHVAVTVGREVHVFDAATGGRKFITTGPAADPFDDACRFSPDGSELAVISGADRLRRVRVEDGRTIAEY
jgi:tRNA A-37 threonylcarbamoyl transferase component Bud32